MGSGFRACRCAPHPATGEDTSGVRGERGPAPGVLVAGDLHTRLLERALSGSRGGCRGSAFGAMKWPAGTRPAGLRGVCRHNLGLPFRGFWYHAPVPELPDVTVYVEALGPRVVGFVIDHVRVLSPFVVRTFEPPFEAVEGRRVVGVSRVGKRIVLELEDELFVVMHLMIAGRLRWVDGPDARAMGGKAMLASLHLGSGALSMIEASKQKRASLHVVAGRDALAGLHRGGIDVLGASDAAFGEVLARERHTLKRALTDPRLFDGIGNAYSDEILHAARLSPFKLTTTLSPDEVGRLAGACRGVLGGWTERLLEEFTDRSGWLRFPGPGEITAFRAGFAVHGRYGQPCPACATPVQRVVYTEREFNYCAACQTEGKVLADRSLSRLLRDDWPRTVEELEGA